MTSKTTKETTAPKTGKAKSGELTPLLQQYQQIKSEHPEHVLFFRCGDFYEMFFEDARTCSEVLGITLTSRGTDTEGMPVPLAGVPYHSVDGYLARMIRAGFRVPCVSRRKTRKTPKALYAAKSCVLLPRAPCWKKSLLTDKANNYLVALVALNSDSEDENLRWVWRRWTSPPVNSWCASSRERVHAATALQSW